jgi:hypothetical protein
LMASMKYSSIPSGTDGMTKEEVALQGFRYTGTWP